MVKDIPSFTMPPSYIKYFETDGIRGKFGKEPVTSEFAMRLGYCFGKVLVCQSSEKLSVLLGRDTRISGPLLESALAFGLAKSGVDVKMLGVIPTPALAYLTKTSEAAGGIVISASHNPFEDNGFKFFSKDGQKIPEYIEGLIEQKIFGLKDELKRPEESGDVDYFQNGEKLYSKFCLESLISGVDLSYLKIVVDCANGATYRVAPSIFRQYGSDVKTLGISPNGYNINRLVGSTYPSALQKAVVELSADVGIAFDGDGDRVVMVDRKGGLLDGDDLLFVIANHYFRSGRLNGGVVGTQMSNLGLEQAIRGRGIGFERTRIGDRFVMERLEEKNWILGGESSGHIICRNIGVSGDGIVGAIQVLESMANEKASLDDLAKGIKKVPQALVNVTVEDKKAVLNSMDLSEAISNAEDLMNDRGRILIRASGTESLIRVMVEGYDIDWIEALSSDLSEKIKKIDKGLNSKNKF